MRSESYPEYRLERAKMHNAIKKAEKALEFADKSEETDEYYDQALIYALLAVAEELQDFNRNAMLMRANKTWP